jgi:hypothetical protein
MTRRYGKTAMETTIWNGPTAKASGLQLPAMLLGRADEVVE